METPKHFNHVPPHADDLELAVLGAMLVDADGLRTAMGLLGTTEDVFYQAPHRLLFRSMVRLFIAGRAVDAVSLHLRLGQDGALPKHGVLDAYEAIVQSVNSSAHVETHVLQLLELYTKRRMGEIGRLLVAKSYDAMQDSFELLTEAQKLLNSAHAALQLKRPRAVAELYDSIIDDIVHATEQTGGLTGVPAGLSLLDRLTGGWQDSDLVIIAARPGMGKTSLVLSNGVYAAKAGYPGAIFSLEMGERQLVRKMVATEAGYTTQQLLKGKLDGGREEAEAIRERASKLKSIGLYIDDTASLSLGELRAKATKLKAEYGIRWIVVDYLQLMTAPEVKGNREQEISAISRGLKKLAKELDLPVMALSQLSRSVEQRGGDKRPMLSDLRESGAIEQDADMVVFLYRAEYYKIMEDEMGNSTKDTTELIVAKHRNGSTATGDDALIVSSKMAFGRYSDIDTSPAPAGERAFYDKDTRTTVQLGKLPESRFEEEEMPF
ncbi:replicative DNA helicase [Hymenobacter cellulosivorans]|uniref:Replicative DNA helicase n=1 Tax=Hymenobacter cellulosivorans TaxID=2932249 RepID=A0ABY4F8S5_9BACT|nr:replicative DNA helicase [Hymenobacter cellulosivorans]UOQ53078.1 replicative DNA helicase [Hymenobacter cellulosivorans]